MPRSGSICSRALVPIVFRVWPPLPIRIPFCESRSTTIEACTFVRLPSRSISSITTAIECGHFLAGDREGLLADELGEPDLEGLVGDLAVGEQRQALPAGARASTARSSSTPVPDRGRDRHDLVEVPERLGGRQLRHHLRCGRSRSILLTTQIFVASGSPATCCA